jgi:uncharacterized protein (TIGR03437 family)
VLSNNVARRFGRSTILCLCLCSSAFPATLSIPNQTAYPSQTLVAPVVLATGGAAIAGIQFDLQWDPSLAVQIASGITLGQSSKALYVASLSPATVRCLIVGMNQTSLTDGEAVELFISTGSGAAGATQMNLTNVVATDGNGKGVSLQPIAGSIQIQSGASPALSGGTVLNGGSLLSGPIAPGEIVTLFGSYSLAPTILFNGVMAPVIYAGVNQVNAIVPFGLDLSQPADLQIRAQNLALAEGSIPVTALAPAIFTQSGTGTGPSVALNQDYSLNTASNPAAANSILMVYGSGFGLLQSPVSDGQIVSGAVSLVLPVTATIGGLPAVVTYAGSAPSLVAGVTQINIQVPQGLPSNSSNPIVLTVGSASTPSGVLVSIR